MVDLSFSKTDLRRITRKQLLNDKTYGYKDNKIIIILFNRDFKKFLLNNSEFKLLKYIEWLTQKI